MLFRLLLLFVLVPVAELMLLIRLGEWIGLWPTLGLIVVTGVVGSVLARQQGFSVLRRLQGRLGQGGLPGRELLDGAIILVSGALLLTPGVVTDVIGFAGLIPPTRALIRAGLGRWLKKKVRSGSANFQIFWSGSGPAGGPSGRSGPGSGGDPGGSGGPASSGPRVHGEGAGEAAGARSRSGPSGSGSDGRGRRSTDDAEEVDVSYEIVEEDDEREGEQDGSQNGHQAGRQDETRESGGSEGPT